MPIHGLDQLNNMIRHLEKNTIVTVGDLGFAMDQQAGRILDRTAIGIDFDEGTFAPYSEHEPYYYYPEGVTGKAAEAHLTHVHSLTKPHGTRTAKGIRYVSYGAFKRALGRFVVDLLGPVAPHMLEQFQMEINGAYSWYRRGERDWNSGVEPGKYVTLQILGDKGRIAAGHNEGNPAKHLPERKFFAISASDQERIFEDVRRRIYMRIEGRL